MTIRIVVAILVLLISGAVMAQISEADQSVLSQLQAAGSDLSKPHDINHWLYFNTQSQAESAAKKLKTMGFTSVSVTLSERKWRVEAHNLIVPSPSAVAANTNLLEVLAAKHGGEYDGWETQVLK